MNEIDNPPWADRVVKKYCKVIQHAARQTGMPMPLMDKPCVPVGELGSGVYGVVFETEQKGIVFKLTSDEAEAKFIAIAMRLAEQNNGFPYGIVKYFGCYQLVGASHERRPLFVVWREEADYRFMGSRALRKWTVDHEGDREWQKNNYDYFVRAENKASTLIMQFKHNAQEMRPYALKMAKRGENAYFDFIEDQRQFLEDMSQIYYETKDRVMARVLPLKPMQVPREKTFAYHWAACEQLGFDMQSQFMCAQIGEAMSQYLRDGCLIADVHTGNIGFPLEDRDGYQDNEPVITDPGQVILLNREVAQIEVPTLEIGDYKPESLFTMAGIEDNPRQNEYEIHWSYTDQDGNQNSDRIEHDFFTIKEAEAYIERMQKGDGAGYDDHFVKNASFYVERVPERDRMNPSDGMLFDMGKAAKRRAERKKKVVTWCLMSSRLNDFRRYYRHGEDAKDWYGQTYATILELFNHDQARTDLFILLLAATSPLEDIKSNVRLALYALKLYDAHGADEKIFKKAFRFQAHRDNIMRSFRGEPLRGPKVSTFAKNLFGPNRYPDAADVCTVDRWMMRAAKGICGEPIDPGDDAPSLPEYRCIQKAIQKLAAEEGVETRQYQAGVWAGIKRLCGDPRDTVSPFEVALRQKFQDGQSEFDFGVTPDEMFAGVAPMPEDALDVYGREDNPPDEILDTGGGEYEFYPELLR